MDKRVQFIEASTNFHNLSLEQQAHLLATLVVQLEPKKIHLVNSVAGYIALQKFSDIIARASKIFITIFMIDKTPEGRSTHKFTECITDTIDDVTEIYADNQAVIDQLVDLMGVDRDKFRVLYQPINLKRFNTQERFKTRPSKVLWAGRLDRQKRPDILAAIVNRDELKNIAEFHVFGSAELGDYNYEDFFKQAPELRFHGSFAGGLNTLKLTDYDIFLMTSQWEGYPNVLLEAIAGGLLPVAPKVGGIAELINTETGYLIEQYDDIDAYVKAIQKSIAEKELSNKLIRQAQQVVRQRHGPLAFQQVIKSIKEYLD
jgi:glycosyltransferase involved in cell wall biosynthesis